ncbi:MAG: Uma2 family endonuclease [Armatimonadetes bacterium]|nr:Uma2 family endonuclease [Armatimonadota bacterium]
MSALPMPFVTPEEYLESERAAETKHEYLDGQVFAMAGASLEHNQITHNIGGQLYLQLRGGRCRSFSADLRVKIEETGLYTYPDLVVVCGEIRRDSLDPNTVVNPTLIIEVLSPSTEDYDRGRKFMHYRRIAGLTDYVMVSQEKPWVEHFNRQPDGRWVLTETGDMEDRVALPSIGAEIRLTDIYENVEFPAEDPERRAG